MARRSEAYHSSATQKITADGSALLLKTPDTIKRRLKEPEVGFVCWKYKQPL